jgi:hypothetical protein
MKCCVAIGITTAGNSDPCDLCPDEIAGGHPQILVLKMPFVDGAYYHGICRNARVARYVAATNHFIYMREKFGSVYPESIGHAENDDGFDLFQPYGTIENPPFDIPQRTDRSATGERG